MRGLSLNGQVLLGTITGLIIGLCLNFFGTNDPLIEKVIYLCTIVGGIFIGLLKMILIPLVFTSLAVGVTQLKAEGEARTIWKLSLIYFIGTSALAVLLGMIVINIIQPGKGLSIDIFQTATGGMALQKMNLPDFIHNFILNLFVNPIQAMAQGQVLPVLIFAIFVGLACVSLGTKTKGFTNILKEAFEIIMKLVQWIMYLAPFGIAALLIKLLATQDIALFAQLGTFIGVVLFALLFHAFVQLPLLLIVLGKKSPFEFFTGIKNAMLTAFSTSSSAATLPITMECVKNNLKVDKDVAGFVLPLGATINMDGTALYEAMAALFVANIAGIELSIVQQLIVFFIAITAAIGAPGIPSAGMVTLVMVLEAVGLPTEAIVILLPIDRLLDSFRTAINVEGDSIGAYIISHKLNPK